MSFFNSLAIKPMPRPLYLIILVFTALSKATIAADAPGSPGLPHSWPPALKQGVGTSYEPNSAISPVWFTVSEGILTEVFYPSVDAPQIADLQFIVTDGKNFFSEQRKNVYSEVSYVPDTNEVVIRGTDHLNAYTLVQKIITDPTSATLRIQTEFRWKRPGLKLFVLFKPALNNGVKQNIAEIDNGFLVAQNEAFVRTARFNRRSFTGAELPIATALSSTTPFKKMSAGYVGFSDGWQELSKIFDLKTLYNRAGPGNIALTGEFPIIDKASSTIVDLAISFSSDSKLAETIAKKSLQSEFSAIELQFVQGWKTYLQGLLAGLTSSEKRSALTIKAHEDKFHPGGIVASLSKPGAPESDRATDANIGGYHLIWPRDLYYAAMGLLAAGDFATPVNVLQYLTKNQRSDGSWNQNFWIDGSLYWKGIQMDQIGFPILLAQQLLSRGVLTLAQINTEMISKAASYIIKNGPATQQDRWEEVSGYVPSTLSVEIAALRAAFKILEKNEFKEAADKWEQSLDSWIKVDAGIYGSNYYLRSSPTGSPNSQETIDLANGAGSALASSIVDGGFLSFIWMGIKSFDNETIKNSLNILDSAQLSVAQFLPNGSSIYKRYNKDNYGPEQTGGYWPLLAAERGKYAIASSDFNRAKLQIELIEKSALPSGVIPEQIIALSPVFQVGHGVACPLVWAHAEHLMLNRSLRDRKIFDSY